MEKLSWKKGFFKCAYQILSGSEKVGELKSSRFTLSATGKLADEHYKFQVKEGLCNRVEIIDLSTKETVGRVRFGRWLPTATIDYQGETYKWKFSNLFETRWKITDSQQNTLNYKGWSCSGSTQGNLPPNLITLTGLFISTYYWQMSAIYAAIIITPLTFFVS